MKHKGYGFTIVELLIVIVVIAILAAISIVAYNGIQQRANNTAIINAASQSMRLLQAYIAQEGAYPFTTSSANICITTESGCASSGDAPAVNANATFDANMRQVGNLPRSVPVLSGGDRYGVLYQYSSNRTLDGQSQPAVMKYYLQGTNQRCNLPGLRTMDVDGSTLTVSVNTVPAVPGHKTYCEVNIPGPGV